jgi:hypothetical protein
VTRRFAVSWGVGCQQKSEIGHVQERQLGRGSPEAGRGRKGALASKTKESTMQDDPSKTALDRKLVSLEQEHELRYWTEVLGCTEQELRRAVAQVGNSVRDVRDYLGR